MNTTILLATIIIVLLGLLTFMYRMFTRLNKRIEELQEERQEGRDKMITSMHERIDKLNETVSDTLRGVTDSVLKQLSETTKQVDKRLHHSNKNWQKSAQEIRKTMQGNEKTIRKVTNKLSEMQEAHKRIFEVGKDISGLQEILRAPKLRGTLGELFLGDLLGQILPHEHFETQYSFKTGEAIDAIIRLRDGHLVPIDAKFPLESFKRMLDADDEDEKVRQKKKFVKSVKIRIDEIADKYINTDEGTLEFALMYIPAENVYYETIIRGEEEYGDLVEYAYKRRVIPVSPNNLYVYLQTIALGLRGMQIEERAREILADLNRLNTDFQKVTESYEIMGKHLSSAQSRYEETNRLLGRFGSKVEQIEEKTQDETDKLPSGST